MGELLGAMFALSMFAIGAIVSECFYGWALAYKKRGYCTKRQLRKIERWLEKYGKV